MPFLAIFLILAGIVTLVGYFLWPRRQEIATLFRAKTVELTTPQATGIRTAGGTPAFVDHEGKITREMPLEDKIVLLVEGNVVTLNTDMGTEDHTVIEAMRYFRREKAEEPEGKTEQDWFKAWPRNGTVWTAIVLDGNIMLFNHNGTWFRLSKPSRITERTMSTIQSAQADMKPFEYSGKTWTPEEGELVDVAPIQRNGRSHLLVGHLVSFTRNYAGSDQILITENQWDDDQPNFMWIGEEVSDLDSLISYVQQK